MYVIGEPGVGRGTGAQRGSTFIYFSMVLTQAAVDTTTSEVSCKLLQIRFYHFITFFCSVYNFLYVCLVSLQDLVIFH
jgi:hypothetical protein